MGRHCTHGTSNKMTQCPQASPSRKEDGRLGGTVLIEGGGWSQAREGGDQRAEASSPAPSPGCLCSLHVASVSSQLSLPSLHLLLAPSCRPPLLLSPLSRGAQPGSLSVYFPRSPPPSVQPPSPPPPPRALPPNPAKPHLSLTQNPAN